MKLLRAEIQGFRSFSEVQSIDFSTMRPGLYLVAGKNLVEPELEANGAGKSSLLEAVYWALYGKTSRGLRAGTVKNWNSKETCGVVLNTQIASGDLAILRTWGPNSLEVSGENIGERPVDQTELEQLIGVSPEAFLYSIYFAQFSPSFIDLAPSEQTTVFSTVLNLDLWDRASKTANEQSREIELQIQQLKESTARIQGQAEELLSQDYAMAAEGWEKGYRAEIRAAEDGVKNTGQSAKALEAEAKVYRKVAEEAEKQRHLVYELESDRRRLMANVTDLSRQNITTCPTCGQSVDRQHIKKELAKAKAALVTKEKTLGVENKKAETLQKQLPKNYETLYQEAVHSYKTAEHKLQLVKQQTNPYAKLQAEQERRGKLLADQLDKANEALVVSEKQIKAVQYWIKGFKDIRLSLIRGSLAQLTIEVNETLYQLGLQNWSIEFDIEKENKSGGINRSFTVLIRSPYTEDAVPWGVWSGGESQRLRLAISLGFANLITSRMGIQPNVEMFDEPSQWLSETGIQDLLTVLAERATRQKKIILLADHRVLDFGGFAGTILVTKDKNGSTISTV